MKKILYVLLLGLLFTSVKAKTSFDFTFPEIKANVNTEIIKYKSYNNYIVISDETNIIKYVYNNKLLSLDSNYQKGGLLNLFEYNVIGNENSYLYDGNKYWMMTESDSNNTYVVDNVENGYSINNNTNYSGFRLSEYVRNDTLITGNGTYVNPWKFVEVRKVNYIVRHNKENLDGTYSLAESETFENYLGYYVKPDTKEYEGYDSPSSTFIELKEGENIINYNYDRKEFTLTFEKDAGISNVNTTGTYKYGESVNINATVFTSYNWDKWTVEGTSPGGLVVNTRSQTITVGNGNVILRATSIVNSACKPNPYTTGLLNSRIISDNCVYGDNVASTYATSATGINFGAISSNTNGKGLYSNVKNSESGNVYYFRGAVTNNYVSFAGLTWRIIRIDSNGTIRMILDHNIATTDWAALGRVAANTSSKKNSTCYRYKYLGYTYCGGNNVCCNTCTSYYITNGICVNGEQKSTIKNVVDNWYNSTLKTTYESRIATASYCNDVQHTSASRVLAYTPSYTCNVTRTYYEAGNVAYGGNYNLKIGLINADELAYAGAVSNVENKTFFLYDSTAGYWTMTPRSVWIAAGSIHVFALNKNGKLTDPVAGDGLDGNPNYTGGWSGTFNESTGVWSGISDSFMGARPVISLNANIQYVSGEGTNTNPYVVQ